MDLQKVLGQLLSNNSMGSNVLGELIGGISGGGQGSGKSGAGAGALVEVLGSMLGGKGGSGGGGGAGAGAGAGGLGAITEMLGGAGGSGGIGDLLGGLLGGMAPQQNLAAAPEPETASAPEPGDADSEAEILIRAMCNAAKSDGSFDKSEQDNILGKLGEVEQDEIDFIRNELAQPLDVAGFAASVPVGQEQKVYAMSVLAIKLDEQAEAQYLAQLAQGLRLEPDTCNQIHAQFGAPQIFR